MSQLLGARSWARCDSRATPSRQEPRPNGLSRLPAGTRARRLARWQARAESVENEAERDLEAEVEAFMRKQAEAEGSISDAQKPERVLGADIVSDSDAEAMCKGILSALRTLMDKRDMTVNEVKLILQIEDPRAKEQRQMGIEDKSGISRDEIALAFTDVVDGRVPKDRIALKVLHEEMVNWPFLEVEGKPAADVDATSIREFESQRAGQSAVPGYRAGQAQPPIGSDPNEEKESLADMLPDWVGYGFLYGVSAVPVIIALSAVAVLFYNSLQ